MLRINLPTGKPKMTPRRKVLREEKEDTKIEKKRSVWTKAKIEKQRIAEIRKRTTNH
tara:strand:+ start:256 stop:426 length:171 start_codon:yes stop_codon:yes gene_type:complete